MSGGDGRPDEELFSILDDEYAREILVRTREEPRSAQALSDECDASRSTIYRRIDRLRDQDLLEGRQQLDPDGHHREVFAARLQRVTVEVTPDGLEIEVDRSEEDAANRFTRLYEEFTG